MYFFKSFFLFCLAAIFCQPAKSQPARLTNNKLKQLAKYMFGSFSSEAQSQKDTSYFNIKLRLKPIWQNNTDGYWMYVEQAVAATEDKPYRQRVYHLYLANDTTIVSKVYEIKSPENYIGAWKDEQKRSTITPDSLIDRQGCSIFLHTDNGVDYYGSTRGAECLSSLRGAAYATSEVTILADRLLSWDRGWSKEGIQVWGAKKGGYIFIKQGQL